MEQSRTVTRMSELQTHAMGTVAPTLDRQRRAVCLLLDASGQTLRDEADDPAVEVYQRLLPLESFGRQAGGTPLCGAIEEAAAALASLQRALLGLTGHATVGLPGGLWEAVPWCLLVHAPLKVYTDELCAYGQLDIDKAWWPPGPGEKRRRVDLSVLGVNAEGGLMAAASAADSLGSLLPLWGPEAAEARVRRLLRAESALTEYQQRFEAWETPDGAAGSSRCAELAAVLLWAGSAPRPPNCRREQAHRQGRRVPSAASTAPRR